MAHEIPRLVEDRGWHGRAVAALIVFAFFVRLAAHGDLGPLYFDLRILWTLPLFVMGILAYEVIGHAADALLAALHRSSASPSEDRK